MTTASPTSAHLQWGPTNAPNTLFFDCVESEEWDTSAEITKHPVEKRPGSLGQSVTDNVRPEPRKVTFRVFATNEPSHTNNWASPAKLPLALNVPTPTWVSGSGIVTYDSFDNLLSIRALGSATAGLIGGAIAGPGGSAIGAVSAGLVGGLTAGGIKVPVSVVTDAGHDPPQPTGPVAAQTWQFFDAEDFVRLTVELLDTLLLAGTLFTVVGRDKTVANMVLSRVGRTSSVDTGTGASFLLMLEEIVFVETSNVPAPTPAPGLPGATPPAAGGAQSTSDSKKDSLFLQALSSKAMGAGAKYVRDFLAGK
jgi:hypothetical protein